MELGTFLTMLVLAYATGLLWYDLLPGQLPERVWRVAAYPFMGIFTAEALLPAALMPAFNPQFGGVHLIAVFLGSLVGVIVDWIVRQARRPALVAQPEPRLA